MMTSSFTRYKNRENGVSIAVSTPITFSGPAYPPLYPNITFLAEYKRTAKEDIYTKAYKEIILSKLDPDEVYHRLENSVLLCWEHPGEFCHRRIVAEWLQNELGVIILEYGMAKPKAKGFGFF